MRFFDEHFVYLYSTPDGTPVYAGCTCDLKRRKSQHKLGSWWWSADLQVTYTTYSNIGLAMDAEAVLINDLRPWGNKVVPADPRDFAHQMADAEYSA